MNTPPLRVIANDRRGWLPNAAALLGKIRQYHICTFTPFCVGWSTPAVFLRSGTEIHWEPYGFEMAFIVRINTAAGSSDENSARDFHGLKSKTNCILMAEIKNDDDDKR